MGDFETFLRLRRRKLAMIASHTKGEHSLGDVQSEAYFMALSLEARLGRPLDWSSDTDQSLLIAYLYQKLVRWTETTVRFAIRIDKEMDDAEGDPVNPVMRSLVSDEGRDPLALLIEREDQSVCSVPTRYCLASAYARLLGHFNNRMRSVADHLLISLSHAYRCCGQARSMAANQSPVPGETMPGTFLPGPWRSFRICRHPEQLAFDFREQRTLLAEMESIGVGTA